MTWRQWLRHFPFVLAELNEHNVMRVTRQAANGCACLLALSFGALLAWIAGN